MPAAITLSCPDGHYELSWSGGHEGWDDDEAYLRDFAIPESLTESCPVCDGELYEEVES